MTIRSLLLLPCIALFLGSCKKEEDGTQPGGANYQGPRQLLNDNSGFREVYVKSDSALIVNPSTGRLSLYAPQAISVLPGGTQLAYSYQLHVSHSSRASVTLGLLDLATGKLAAPEEPTNFPAPDASYPEIAGFIPHTNQYYYTEFVTGNPAAWDIKGKNINQRFINWAGTPRISKTGDYVMNDAMPFYWKSKSGRIRSGGYIPSNNAHFYGSVFEPLPVGGQQVLFMLRSDSLFVAQLDTVNTSTRVPLYKAKVAGLETASANLDFRHRVRTTPTASRIGVCFKMTLDKVDHFWTATYDQTTQTAALVLNNVVLPYGGEGSDYDIDENGNLYYSGYADSGKNKGGVSIYKQTPSGSSLVGADNFLRQGEIMLLRYEAGKVWLGISLYQDKEGKQVRPQLSFMKQE